MTLASRATLVAGVSALLARLAGVSTATTGDGAAPVTEARQQYVMPGRGAQAALTWRLLSALPLGVDELRSAYDPDTQPEGDEYAGEGAPLGSVVYTATGQRRMVFQVECESGEWERDGAYYLQRIQWRLRLPSALAELSALGLGLSHVGGVVDVGQGAEQDGHAVTRYAFEFWCNAATEADDDPITTIETFDVNSTVS